MRGMPDRVVHWRDGQITPGRVAVVAASCNALEVVVNNFPGAPTS